MSASTREKIRSQFPTVGYALRAMKRLRGPSVQQRIDAAAMNLPSPAAALVKRVAKRTRLFPRERLSVAIELISHFAEGIAAGERVETLIAAFGDERTAAILMRRAKRRSRPRWLRATTLSVKAVGMLAMLYAGVGVYFALGRSTQRVDYLEMLNEPAWGRCAGGSRLADLLRSDARFAREKL